MKVLKKIFFFFLLVNTMLIGVAQEYGHEWINFNQIYYKISVAQSGMYRVSYNELIQAGVPISSVDPRTIQLWRRGKEQAISVVGQEDGTFNTTDYIDFYGEKNDAQQELGLYKEGVSPLNPYLSIHTDTSAYFLTWSLINEQGKRISIKNTQNYSTQINDHYQELLVSFTERYAVGRQPVSDTYRSYMDEGEGWCSGGVTHGKSRTFEFALPDVITGTVQAEVMFVGTNSLPHKFDVNFGGVQRGITTLEGHESVLETFTFDVISDQSVSLKLSVFGVNKQSDNISVAYVKILYPQKTTVSVLQKVCVFEKSQEKNNVVFSDLSEGELYDITIPEDVQLIKLTNQSFGLEPFSTPERRFLAVKKKLIIGEIQKVTFKEHDQNADYLLISSKAFENTLQDYISYRESVQGGSYNVEFAEVQELMNQYAYGEWNPMAIRNYCDFMYNEGSAKFLFLVGKGLRVFYGEGSSLLRFTAKDQFSIQNHVPTFGFPGTDILYSVGLDKTKPLVPALATGRLSVNTNAQITAYFNKVREHEGLEFNALWRKNILHLSGGVTQFEPIQILGYMNSYKKIVEDTLLGGVVETFTRLTTDEVEFYNISAPVNEGISLLNFFGHSSPQGIGIDFGEVSDPINGYSNKGKYPCLMINGCHAGEIFTSSSYTRAEDWLFTADKGAIAALAHSSYGYSLMLHRYTGVFYQNAYQNEAFFGKSLGVIQQETIEDFFEITGTGELARTHANQFILIGDPAISLFPADQADYEITNGNLSIKSFSDEQITALSDSFQLHIPIVNYGKAIPDSFNVCITRKFANDQSSKNYQYRTPVILNQDTLIFTIYSEGINSAGLNTFEIQVDCDQEILEYDEFNNFAKIDYFFPLNSVFPLLPKEFSLLGNSTVSFTGQSYDLFIPNDTEYLFQLDTSEAFSTPLVSLEQKGGTYPRWEDVELPLIVDSTVYYWRVRLKESELPDELAWQSSSFMYIKGKSGWAQGDAYQFIKDTKTDVYQNLSTSQWSFDTTQVEIHVSSAGNQNDQYWEKSFVVVDEKPIVRQGLEDFCTQLGVFVVVFDRETGIPYNAYKTPVNGACGPQPRVAMSYSLSSKTNQDRFMEYVDLVPKNDLVLVSVTGDGQYTAWNPAFKDYLKDAGAKEVDNLIFKVGHPYILLFQKSTGKVLFEKVGEASTDILDEYITITGIKETGTIKSTVIGPATEWFNYYHTFKGANEKELAVEIYGRNLSGEETFLYKHTASDNIQDSISFKTDIAIDANEYPYLVVKSLVSDSVTSNIPQLKNWLITYEGVPEGVMNPFVLGGASIYNLDAIQEGDSIQLSFAFQNISSLNFSDTLSVQYIISNQATGESMQWTKKLSTLKNGENIIFDEKISSIGFVGENKLQVYVNPKLVAEEYYNNNILTVSFDVKEDKQHPVLEVLFDGLHILDGEIVSPNPYITIEFHDENKFLFKKDTTEIELFIKAPCEEGQECEYEPIYFSNPEIVSWTPASAKESFRIEYNPQSLKNGVYTLRVQGVDASSNVSSVNAYEIHFQVINESTVTNFLPYPNPFSTQTRFVFTLTGADIPDEIKIQIMTISGKVVREITQDELGPIRIGNNISEYAWDGRDEFGDLLANGVYLYRVILKVNGEEIKHRETSIDKAFHREFGKMYILR